MPPKGKGKTKAIPVDEISMVDSDSSTLSEDAVTDRLQDLETAVTEMRTMLQQLVLAAFRTLRTLLLLLLLVFLPHLLQWPWPLDMRHWTDHLLTKQLSQNQRAISITESSIRKTSGAVLLLVPEAGTLISQRLLSPSMVPIILLTGRKKVYPVPKTLQTFNKLLGEQ
jgi:hypothetical protein